MYPGQPEPRQQHPHEHHAERGVEHVDGHAARLLAEPAQAAVGHGVEIHHRHERREQPDVAPCVVRVVDQPPERSENASSSTAVPHANSRHRYSSVRTSRRMSPAPAGDLCRRQLRHEQICQRVQQARREEHHRQRHTVHDAVARERAVGRQAGAFEPARDEQVLQCRQRRARIGRHGQRQRHGEHPPRQVRHGVAAAAVFAPVERIHRRHQQQRHHVRARAACRDGGAALLEVTGAAKDKTTSRT